MGPSAGCPVSMKFCESYSETHQETFVLPEIYCKLCSQKSDPCQFQSTQTFWFPAIAQDFGLSKEGVDKFGGTKSFCGSVACPCTGLPSRNAAVPV